MLQKAVQQIAHIGDQLAQKQQVVVAALDNAVTLLKPTLAAPVKLPVRPPPGVVVREAPKYTPIGTKSSGVGGYAKLEPVEVDGEFKLTGRYLEILGTLAQYPDGMTSEQLALYLGMKESGGGFGNYMGKLRSHGFIEYQGDNRVLTAQGRAAAPPVEVPTAEGIIARWREKLDTEKAKLMLDAIWQSGGTGISKAELAKLVDMDPDGGGFGNYLGKLHTAGIVAKQNGVEKIAQWVLER